ncbi:hypothetical protein SLEP1_g51639 [Rubroshorea leprosula]|uniref:Uncharacterized protein n=1 Tax=Rubroshorea leprosula TaxID=152421 RepID=A0AAV5M6E5_9ROSI|nr:hypothetical protein SLEP1_g51639 [Rubroshorea leprosula]
MLVQSLLSSKTPRSVACSCYGAETSRSGDGFPAMERDG